MCLKTKRVYARVTEKELKKIKSKAVKGGYKNLSEYMRDKVINKKITEYDFREINRRLSILGERINHTVILCHQGSIDRVDMSSFNEELAIIYKLICNIKPYRDSNSDD
jgi:anaerobic ribonucleoside-triphosphate reductase